MADQVTKKDLQALRTEFTRNLLDLNKDINGSIDRRLEKAVADFNKKAEEHGRRLADLSTAIDQLRGLVGKHESALADLK